MKEDTRQAIDDYVANGWEPGGFVSAVLENNLSEAFGRADLENRRDLFEIVQYVYNCIPATCWGSREKVKAWYEYKEEQRKAKGGE